MIRGQLLLPNAVNMPSLSRDSKNYSYSYDDGQLGKFQASL